MNIAIKILNKILRNQSCNVLNSIIHHDHMIPQEYKGSLISINQLMC